MVRQHRAAQWKTRGGEAITAEFELLKAVHGAGLPVPEPLLLDTSVRWLPGPFLVMELVDGTTDIPADHPTPFLDAMAETLARVHDLALEGLPALPLRTDPLPELFDFLPAMDGLEELGAHLSERLDTAYEGAPVLLHGDFWPGNLIWQQDSLAAILDWEDAALGDPLSDLASSRLELTWKLGPSAADHFTRTYADRRQVDRNRLALWEVYVGAAAARFMGNWGLPAAREAEMRLEAEAFVKSAAAQILRRSPTSDRLR